MAAQTDYDRADRPSTAQPPPEHVPGAPSVHDLVIAEVGDTHPELAALLAERRKFGLAKYGTVLQVEDPKRDARQDLLEELGDAVAYAYRAAAGGRAGARAVYEALVNFTGEVAAQWYSVPDRS